MVDFAKLGIKLKPKTEEENDVAAESKGRNDSDIGSGEVPTAVPGPVRSGAAGLLAKLNAGSVARTVSAGKVSDNDSDGDNKLGNDVSGGSSATPATRPNPLASLARVNNRAKAGDDSDKVNLPAVQAPSVLDTPTEETIPPGPDGFKYKLDMLDALIQRDAGINGAMLGVVKGRIKDIVKELKEFPEYDGLIIDRDIHNIMLFMQQSVNQAKADFVQKDKKRTTKAIKAAKFDFGESLANGPLALEGPTLDLDALSGLNLDDVKAKVR